LEFAPYVRLAVSVEGYDGPIPCLDPDYIMRSADIVPEQRIGAEEVEKTKPASLADKPFTSTTATQSVPSETPAQYKKSGVIRTNFVTTPIQESWSPGERVILFKAAGVLCGFNADDVKEILPYRKRAEGLPAQTVRYNETILDIIDLRPIIAGDKDLNAKHTTRGRIIVLHAAGTYAGVIADSVQGIRSMNSLSTLNRSASKAHDWVRSYHTIEGTDDVVSLLDAESLSSYTEKKS
jgi:chemotaxis signal transduction protein